jgi:hypothetical protein
MYIRKFLKFISFALFNVELFYIYMYKSGPLLMYILYKAYIFGIFLKYITYKLRLRTVIGIDNQDSSTIEFFTDNVKNVELHTEINLEHSDIIGPSRSSRHRLSTMKTKSIEKAQ